MSEDRARRYLLRRRALVAELPADRERDQLLVVSTLGAPTWDVTAAGDSPSTFPLWGAMGGAALTGLGLALAQPGRRVLVVTGDGEMLMGLGALATVALQAPPNLAVVVLDNERYGETGMQPTHTAGAIDLAAMAAAAGFAHTATVREPAAVPDAAARLRSAPGPLFYVFKVRAEDLPLAKPPKDGAYLKDRFRIALLGEQAAVG